MATSAANLRKRRDVVRASITRLGTCLRELEETSDQPRTPDHARKLKSLDEDFKKHHFELIDKVDGDEALEKEQTVLDKHDGEISSLSIRLQTLLAPTKTIVTPAADDRKLLSRKLSHLEAGLSRVDDMVSTSPGTPVEPSLLKQCQEQISDYRKDLPLLYDGILAMDVADEDELLVSHFKLEKLLFDRSHKIKKSLTAAPAESTSTDSTEVKLPKLDVPTFKGNIIHWKQFWEQFTVSVHDRSKLSNAEKIVYLQHAIKDGSTRNAIEGLSHSGDNYDEAIECLKSRFDWPRLIHRTHVQMIIDAPPLKEGTGKELR